MTDARRDLRLYSTLLDDPKVQRLSPAAFKAEVTKALRGEPSKLDPHVNRERA